MAARGRPRGSKNKRQQFDVAMTNEALRHLKKAVEAGQQWAVSIVIARQFPPLKPVTVEGSIDADLIKARIKEIVEFDERLKELEANIAKNDDE